MSKNHDLTSHQIKLKEKIIEECNDYLKEFPNAKKFLFLSEQHTEAKLSVKDYVDALIESWGLSETEKFKNHKNCDPELESKTIEFIELSKLASRTNELEELNKLNKNSVYTVFMDTLNFYRSHDLFFSQFKKLLNEYIDIHCQGEVAHRVIGKSTQKWLDSQEYNEELIGKFKEYQLSLSANFKKIVNDSISRLDQNQKDYIRARCLDEIMSDKIICNLFDHGLLPDVALDRIKLSGQRKAKSMASLIENSRYFYTSLMSIEQGQFISNSWLF